MAVIKKTLVSVAAVAALGTASIPAAQANDRAGAVIAGAVVGAVIGGLLLQHAHARAAEPVIVHRPEPVVYGPPPVVYGPPPVVYREPRVVYAPAPRVVYYPAPVYQPRVVVRHAPVVIERDWRHHGGYDRDHGHGGRHGYTRAQW